MDNGIGSMPFDFLSGPSEIFRALLESKERGTAIGIKANPLGRGMFVTAVQDILVGDGNENTQIILKGYDFTGHILETNVVKLNEIEGVCVFASKFGNPILSAVKKILKF